MEVATPPNVASPPPNALVQPNLGMAEYLRYKNNLQEFTQRSAIPLPLYQTVNEGSPHCPQFRSSVTVDGVTFKSGNAFPNRKAAEQDVARVALEGLSRRIQQEGCHLLNVDIVFCKSILNEYAVKINVPLPTYTSSQAEGLLPIFISTVCFEGKTYKGGAGKNKKEAEQMAARAVIESILGNSSARNLMAQIIKSKGKLYAAIHKIEGSSTCQAINMPSGGYLGIRDTKEKGKDVLPVFKSENPPAIAQGEAVPASVITSPGASLPLTIPKSEYTCESGQVGCFHRVQCQLQVPPSVVPVGGSIGIASGYKKTKKRKKNKGDSQTKKQRTEQESTSVPRP